MDSDVTVTASWSGPGGAITTGVTDMTDTAPYHSTLTLSSLVTSDSGTYTCIASVDPVDLTYITESEDGSDTHIIAVGRCTTIILCTISYVFPLLISIPMKRTTLSISLPVEHQQLEGHTL